MNNLTMSTLVYNCYLNGGKLPNFVYDGKERVAVRVKEIKRAKQPFPIPGARVGFIGQLENGEFRHFHLDKMKYI